MSHPDLDPSKFLKPKPIKKKPDPDPTKTPGSGSATLVAMDTQPKQSNYL